MASLEINSSCCTDRRSLYRQNFHFSKEVGIAAEVKRTHFPTEWTRISSLFQGKHSYLHQVSLFSFIPLHWRELTIPTVELDSVGWELDWDTALAGLWEFKILNLAIRAEYIHIQDCQVQRGSRGGFGEERWGEKRMRYQSLRDSDSRAWNGK